MKPKFITIHCSATKPKNKFSVEQLRHQHVNVNGWSDIGYHFYIETNGKLTPCRSLERNGAHVKGFNADNIGICLEGGLNNDTGKPDDTYNNHQMAALKDLVKYLQDSFAVEDENIKGHRDWYGSCKGDWLKMCPCFDVQKWLNK